MKNERKISYEEANSFAESNGLKYIEASAKTYENVDEAFIGTAKEILEKIESKEINPKNEFGIKVGGEIEPPLRTQQNHDSGCC